MSETRAVEKVTEGQPTVEGAGVRLSRAFGSTRDAMRLDPFMLLDDFGSSDPDDYVAGFPWHPHRGMETVTYMLSGSVEHQDSTGTKGAINAGDVQWMTAGSGIIHQEMPLRAEGALRGFQLWVNLPAKSKMTDPKYRDVRKNMIPIVSPEEGVEIMVVAGKMDGAMGPVSDLAVSIEYLDVGMAPGKRFRRSVRKGDNAFAYVYDGSICFESACKRIAHNRNVVWFGDGDQVEGVTHKEGAHFILCCGTPIKEPIAWAGPIVMNTTEELDQAFREVREGTFIKARERVPAGG
jgi:redox-sensitive bicupin YhaK (pirin superfamily)